MSTIRRDLESGTLAKGQDGHFDVKIGLVTTRHYRLDKGTLYRDDFEMNGDRLYIDSVDIQTSPRPAYGVHLIPLRISYQYKGVTYEERELCVKTI